MFDHLLRGLKDRLLAPLAGPLRGVPPTLISLVALLAGLGSAVAGWRGAWTLGLVLWLSNRVLDGLDGTVARLAGTQSDFGGYVDIIADFIVYAAIPVAVSLESRDGAVMLTAAVLEATFFVNAASWMYLSAILEKRASGAAASGELTTVTMPPGLIAGFETVVFFALFFVLPHRLPLLFGVMAALVAVNVVQRLVWARRVL